MPLTFGTSPWLLLLCLAAAVALTWWTYRGTTPALAPSKAALLGGLRALALFLVLFLIFEPLWRTITETERPPVLAVLVDASESLALKGPDSVAVADQARAALSDLGEGAWTEFFAFSREATRIGRSDSLAFDGERTDISTALRAASSALEGENLGAVLLLSDGQYNAGRNPVYEAERYGVPIYTVTLGDTTAQRDLLIRRVLHNEIAALGTEQPVQVTLGAVGYDSPRVDVVLAEDGVILDRQRVTLSGAEATAELTYVPETPGLKRLVVGVTRLGGELTYRNNTAPLTVRVLDSRKRVLLLAGAPDPDLRALRSILEADQNLDLTVRTQRAGGRFYEGALPDSLEAFDLAVLVGYPGAQVVRGDVARVAAAAENGLALLYVMTRQADVGALADFSDVLPINIGARRSGFVAAQFAPTEAGAQHTIMTSAEGAGPSLWRQLPPLDAPEARLEASPDARVLAVQQIRGVRLDAPLLALRQRTGQRSAALLGAGTWRWANPPEDLDAVRAFWQSFAGALVDWLTTPEDDRLVRVTPSKTIFGGDEPVTFGGQVYDESLQPLEGATLDVSVEGPDGARYPFRMEALGGGRYTLDAGTLPPGTYRFTAEATRNGSALGEDRGSFAIGALTAEFRETRADPSLMRQIALRSGGEVVAQTEVAAFMQRLRDAPTFRSLVETQTETARLWHEWIFLVLIVLALAAEWVLRKRSGLV